jgi:ferric-dicitrate binding protein FerR (iron transport regulator)
MQDTERSAPWARVSWIVLALMSGLAIPTAAHAAEPVGRVAEAQGRSTGFLAGVSRELASGLVVFLDETLRTGAEARLGVSLGLRTRVQIGERTLVRIDQALVNRGGEIVLERGSLLFDRQESDEDGGFRVRSPFAVIVTRGTRFFVGQTNGQFSVLCQRGIVTVGNNAGRVVLHPGEGTEVLSSWTTPTKPKVWGAARVAAAMKSVE